ncbi:DUF4377 domain-containing protein [Neisseriaceae bacterium ESL0693]|nr:DUF4377 domain-containing protein [Neisseriaceae bacterium ESL0693]
MNIKTGFMLATMAGALAACAHDRSGAIVQTPTEPVLSQYHWQLVKAVDKERKPLLDLAASGTMQLDFNQQQLKLAGGCNDISAGYQLDKNQLLLQKPVSTRKQCAASEMAKDTTFINFIENPKIKAKIVVPAPDQAQTQPSTKLVLKNVRGDVLVLKGVPTLESLYGQPVKVFWQVSDKIQPCQTANAVGRCLKVREIQYDAQGIKRNVGAWQNFAGRIEGWQPQNNVSEILRLNRYTRQAATATQPADYVYVLDMVVEQQQVIKTKIRR